MKNRWCFSLKAALRKRRRLDCEDSFSADKTKIAANTLCISENFCAICRKNSPQDTPLIFVRCCLSMLPQAQSD
jgi:hypothetical protein